MSAADGNFGRFAFFFDRDGTLIHDPGYLHEPEKVVLLRGVRETLAALKARGCLLFLFTNQSGPARGLCTMDDVLACNRRMEELAGSSPLFDGECIATEHPDAPVQTYRKPSPRFILETIAKFGLDPAKCLMVGDKSRDLESGVAAGIGAIRISADIDDAKAAAYCAAHGLPTVAAFADLLAFAPVQQPATP